MNARRIAIESLAMDLKRVALGLQRGSISMAERFKEEALVRTDEISNHGFDDSHLRKLVVGAQSTLLSSEDRVGEDALMYSTLFQNFAQKNFK